jgi:Fe2+ transport system protein FeoA
MNLADAPLAEPVVILALGGERPFRRRVLELGLLPGTEVTVVRVAPFGDPLELATRGGRLSIRRREAREIEVREARGAK